jgi:hypothetical protein
MSYQQSDEHEEARKRSAYTATILRVLTETAGMKEIEVHLAIGASCTAASRRDVQIWLEQVAACRQLKAEIDEAMEDLPPIGDPEADEEPKQWN